MKLDQFLLARIAEDEDVAKVARPDEYLSTRARSTLVTGADSRGYAFVQGTSSRVLAECEAKRRLLGWATSFDSPQSVLERAVWPSLQEVGDRVKRTLAAVYSDHPDYRQEWAL